MSVRTRRRPAATTPTQAWTLVAGAAVLVAGFITDGWAHTNLGEELESFITPYHALIFLGYLIAASAMVWILRDNLADGRSRAEAVPPGYGAGVIGVAGFAIGFLGDGIWHSIFGIEASIDALLSPTHLLMFVSILLLFTSPIRAAWYGPGGRRMERGERTLVTAATVLTVTTIAFFLLYAWGTGNPAPSRANIGWAGRFDDDFVLELTQIWGLSATFISTVVLIAPLTLLWRRWDPPFGLTAFVFAVPSVLIAAIREFSFSGALPAVLVAGLVVDWILSRRPPRPDAPGWARTCAALAAFVLWALYYLLFGVTEGLSWEPEFWGGAIVFSTLIGYGLGLLAFPPPVPAIRHP